MWHYKVIDINGDIILDSSLREDFSGWTSSEIAYLKALGAKIENRLSDLHRIETFNKFIKG
jgi:hypothetical protein